MILIDPYRGNLIKKIKQTIELRKNGEYEQDSGEFLVEINGILMNLDDLGLVFECFLHCAVLSLF